MVTLLKEIEKCRQEMIELSILYGLTSEDVVQSSKKLDHLLNMYQSKMTPTQC